MKTVEINIQKYVEDLLNEVSENVKGYDVYLGGGMLRDRYCGLPYKDIDIFLVPNGEDKQIVPYQPKGYGISYTKSCEGNDDMAKRGVGALMGLYQRGGEFSHEYDPVRMYCRLKRMKEKFPTYEVYEEIYLTTDQQAELNEKGDYEYEGSA